MLTVSEVVGQMVTVVLQDIMALIFGLSTSTAGIDHREYSLIIEQIIGNELVESRVVRRSFPVRW